MGFFSGERGEREGKFDISCTILFGFMGLSHDSLFRGVVPFASLFRLALLNLVHSRNKKLFFCGGWGRWEWWNTHRTRQYIIRDCLLFLRLFAIFSLALVDIQQGQCADDSILQANSDYDHYFFSGHWQKINIAVET